MDVTPLQVPLAQTPQQSLLAEQVDPSGLALQPAGAIGVQKSSPLRSQQGAAAQADDAVTTLQVPPEQTPQQSLLAVQEQPAGRAFCWAGAPQLQAPTD